MDATDAGMATCRSFACHDAANAIHTTIDASINAPSIASDAGESLGGALAMELHCIQQLRGAMSHASDEDPSRMETRVISVEHCH